MGQHELRTLALEGEALRSAAEAERAAAERTDAIRQRREVRRLGHSNLLDALAEYPAGDAVPLLRWTIGAVLASALLWQLGELGLGPRASAAGLAGVLVIPFLYLAARRRVALSSLRRERAWLHDLPFPVRGYFALLCTTPAEERTVRLRFRLADGGPGEEIVRGLAGRSGGAVRVSRSGGAWEVESGVIRSPAGADSAPTNGPLLAWMRAVVAETLLPLHAEHRVTRAGFRE